MRVSLIQMNSQGDKAANLASARQLMADAVRADRPDMVVLPEMFSHLAQSPEARRAAAEPLPDGDAYRLLQQTARELGVHVHGGSLLELDGDRVFNTTVAFGPDGQECARYRKIHLFDVTTPDGRSYRESDSFSRGSDVVIYSVADAVVGCSICYDLRFPELYQALSRRGATVMMVPAAFTLQTGKDHWEPLLRARAIETQSYVVAPGQTGTYDDRSRACYGHSLVVDPWGQVIACASDTVGFVTARLDFGYLRGVREKIPVHSHKVL